MGIEWTKNTITLSAPDGGEYEIDVEAGWKLISKAVPARINYDENDAPAEAAEYEIQGVALIGHHHYG